VYKIHAVPPIQAVENITLVWITVLLAADISNAIRA
jgi:hypothetical protein